MVFQKCNNGPQLVLEEFRQYNEKYDFTHVTSSPHNAQRNGQAESTVKGFLCRKIPS